MTFLTTKFFHKYLNLNSKNTISTSCKALAKKTFKESKIEPVLSFIPRMHNSRQQQMFDYILVLDFEATCNEGAQIIPQVS